VQDLCRQVLGRHWGGAACEGSIPFAHSSSFLRHARQKLNPYGVCGVLGQDDGRTCLQVI
jgi:hypothetical protein